MHPTQAKDASKTEPCSEAKMNDIEPMFRFMPLADKEYYRAMMKKLAKLVGLN